jgi:tRNA U34 5-methylaminomethyl-2-thiouridine-forming methyltransferase MnmC
MDDGMLDPPSMRVRTIQTADGSTTLQQVDTGWTYRSVHGAALESRHVFVQGTNVLRRGASELSVFEFGFGAAGNFAATVAALEEQGGRLRYCAVDHAPVEPRWLCPEDLRAHRLAARAVADGVAADDTVSLQLHVCDFVDLRMPDRFDAIYFDPFGPTQQPESWSVEVFAIARGLLAPGGRLATYAAAGWVRRNLAAAGFYVATAPGPPGKRHITIAAGTPEDLHPWPIRNAP